MRKWIVLALFFFNFVSCGHLFYYPDREVYDDPSKRKIEFQDFYIKGYDPKQMIHVRYFPSKSKKPWGILWQFHGNAQNLSSHYGSVIWAIEAGLDVITFDYPGYGQSTGKTTGDGIRKDIPFVFNFIWEEFAKKGNLPLFAIGQSLGGAILLKGLEDLGQEKSKNISAIILESTFFSYYEIAKTKLKASWVTYPLNFFVPLLISNQLAIKEWNSVNMPVLILHDLKDPVVPASCSASIEEQLKANHHVLHERLTYETKYGSHTASFIINQGKYQRTAVEWLKKIIL